MKMQSNVYSRHSERRRRSRRSQEISCSQLARFFDSERFAPRMTGRLIVQAGNLALGVFAGNLLSEGYAMLVRPEFSTSISCILPVTVKITRSQMLVTRSAARSRLWATHSRKLDCSMARWSAMT